jgi:hypothetical protein
MLNASNIVGLYYQASWKFNCSLIHWHGCFPSQAPFRHRLLALPNAQRDDNDSFVPASATGSLEVP